MASGEVVYFDHEGSDCRDRYHRRCAGRWRGEINLGKDGQGKRIRRKASAQSKAELTAKLEELRSEVDQGVQSSGRYTVFRADEVDDRYASGSGSRPPRFDIHQPAPRRSPGLGEADERYAHGGDKYPGMRPAKLDLSRIPNSIRRDSVAAAKMAASSMRAEQRQSQGDGPEAGA